MPGAARRYGRYRGLEEKLKAEARRRFPGDRERQDRYVYGTLNRVKVEAEAG